MGLKIENGELIERAKKASEAKLLIEELAQADALVILKLWETPNNKEKTVTISHSRDVASDKDNYTFKDESSLENESMAGWMIPFKSNGGTAFAVLTTDFTCSIHFIKVSENYEELFQKNFADYYLGGKVKKIAAEDQQYIHQDGIHIQLEDPETRLVPTNSDHIEKINEHLLEALSQSLNKLHRSMEARQKNEQNTIDTLSTFLRNLTGNQNLTS